VRTTPAPVAPVALVILAAGSSQAGPAPAVIDAWHFGEVPVARLLEEDALGRGRLSPVRFAEKRRPMITPAESGTLEDLGDGTVRWRLWIESDNALSVNLGLLYDVPASAVVTLRDARGAIVHRPLTAADNMPHGELWTPIAVGTSMEIDAVVDAEEWGAFEAGFWITDVNLGYRGLAGAVAEARARGASRGTEPQDACLVDVACPEADPWRVQVDGVAAYTISGTLTCSGAMLNNTSEDATPYFYTADHCGAADNPAGVVTYWNLQSSYCREVGSAENGEIGDGQFDQPILGGAALIATVPDADSTLLRLLGAVPPAYSVEYLGWDRSFAPVPSSVGISHPGVQEKRIAFDMDPAASGVFDGSLGGLSATIAAWQVFWESGGVNRGSSGSPMIDANGRVVGTATAAGPLDIPNYCPQQATIYGRFEAAWRLSPAIGFALDPWGTGQDTIDYLGFVPAPDCAGDVNGDGATDIFDFGDLADNFGAGPGATREQGDLTGDGFVDVFDFSELAADFGCGGD
jgi:lysyl endopeptidase